jgi:FkbM family methyltransferase
MSLSYIYNTNKQILVTPETVKITPHTFMTNGEIWERDSITNFYNNINDNSYNIIDIGAQSGLYTLYAKFLPSCNFYAFEPFPETFKILNDNIKLNNIQNVKTYNVALSNIEGSAILNTSISHNGLHTLGNNPLRFNDVKPITVKTTTLDKIFYDNNIPVNYIKIDTEGYEYYILNGGINTINKYKPIIQIEWNETNMLQCNVNKYDFEYFINNIIHYKKVSFIEEELIIYPIN